METGILIMSIAYLESKLRTLEKFKFFAELMQKFADSKKQMTHIRKIIFLEFESIETNSFPLDENDNRSVEYYISEIKDIVTRFEKAKKVEDYNRARELLNRCSLEIDEAIKSTKDDIVDAKGKAAMESVAAGISAVGDIFHMGVSRLKKAVKGVTQKEEHRDSGDKSDGGSVS